MRPVHLNIAERGETALVAVRAVLLITTAGYEIHAPISRSFINRLYNCAGKCVAGRKVSHDER